MEGLTGREEKCPFERSIGGEEGEEKKSVDKWNRDKMYNRGRNGNEDEGKTEAKVEETERNRDE